MPGGEERFQLETVLCGMRRSFWILYSRTFLFAPLSNCNQRDLLERGVYVIPHGTTIGKRRDLRHRRPGRSDIRKILRVDTVHSSEVVYIVEVNVGRNNVLELQSGFLHSIEEIAHGHAELGLDGGSVNTLIGTRDKSRLRRAVERIVSPDTGTGSRARRHVFGPHRAPLGKVTHGYSRELD